MILLLTTVWPKNKVHIPLWSLHKYVNLSIPKFSENYFNNSGVRDKSCFYLNIIVHFYIFLYLFKKNSEVSNKSCNSLKKIQPISSNIGSHFIAGFIDQVTIFYIRIKDIFITFATNSNSEKESNLVCFYLLFMMAIIKMQLFKVKQNSQ